MAEQIALFMHFASSQQGGMTGAESRLMDVLSDPVRVMLTLSGYVPDQANHKFKSSVTNEVPGTGGYTTGGQLLTAKTLTAVGGSLYVAFDAADVLWSASTIANAARAVMYNDRAALDADKELMLYIDFLTNRSTAGVDFQIAWNASGIYKQAVSVPV